MCGVLGLVSHEPVNQLLYDGLQMLQHRGQDAAGIATAEGGAFHMHKGKGMVSEVFRTRNMRDLTGNAGIAHVRYPTAGNAGEQRGGAAFLRQLAFRHRFGAQRQPHQHCRTV